MLIKLILFLLRLSTFAVYHITMACEYFSLFLICSGVWSWLFISGLNVGTPTVLVPQLRQEANSSNVVTSEEASWLAAIISYSGAPWVIVLAIIGAYMGRKTCQLLVCTSSLTGFVILSCSSNLRPIMISQIFEGASLGSHSITAIFVLTEYTSPEYRGLFLTIKTGTFFLGVLIANAIGTFLHWRIISYLGMISALYSLVTVYFWPESPLWLAKQERFDECIKSHQWLQGICEKSKKELKNYLIHNQSLKKKVNLSRQITDMKTIIGTKQFYKPVCLSILMYSSYLASGKYVYAVYALEIFKKIAKDTSSAYTTMLILDGVTVFSLYLGCGLAKVFNRRTLLLTTSTISITLLFLLSLYLYLIKLLVISENTYVLLSLLVGFSIAISCGPMILCTTICGELTPINSRSFSMCIIGLVISIMAGTMTKVSPYIFEFFGIHGTFFSFGLCSSVCMVVIYIYLPETKDKTLQEIADCLLTPKAETEKLMEIKENDTFRVREINCTTLLIS